MLFYNMVCLTVALAPSHPVFLQNVQEELDPSLAPILNKAFTKTGGILMLKLGDKDVEYNPSFR
jgi:dynein heavy chain